MPALKNRVSNVIDDHIGINHFFDALKQAYREKLYEPMPTEMEKVFHRVATNHLEHSMSTALMAYLAMDRIKDDSVE